MVILWAFTRAIGKLSASRHYYKPRMYSYEEAKEQVRNGIYVWIREGSAAHNLDAIVQGIVHNKANTEYYGFCTDDKHIEDIRSEGHISYNIRRSIELGLDPVKAYKMASTNTALCYH